MPILTAVKPTVPVAPVKVKATKEEQIHIDARDARVKAVQHAIDEAKLVRDEKEKHGVMETPGAKVDRLAKEAEDLKKAGVLNKIEYFGKPKTTDPILNEFAVKLDEVIAYLNK